MSQDRPTSREDKSANVVVATVIRAITFVKSAALRCVAVPLWESSGSPRWRIPVTLEVMYREPLGMIPVDTEKIVRYNRRMCNPEFQSTEDDDGVQTQTVRVLQVEADSEEQAQAIAKRQITQCLEAEGYEGVEIVFMGVEPEAAV